MATKITNEILESYLKCKLKGRLKFNGERGSKCDYDLLLTQTRAEVKLAAISKILVQLSGEEITKSISLTSSTLMKGHSFILGATLENNQYLVLFDGLKRVEGPSALGNFHYVAVLFYEGEKISSVQKLLLEVYGLLLSGLQGRSPSYGVIWHGEGCKATSTRLSPDCRNAVKLLGSLRWCRFSGRTQGLE